MSLCHSSKIWGLVFFILIFSCLVSIPVAQENPFQIPAAQEGETRVLKVYHNENDFKKYGTNFQITLNESAKTFSTKVHWEGEGKERRLIYTRTEQQRNGNSSIWIFRFAPGKEFSWQELEHCVSNSAGVEIRREIYNMVDPSLALPQPLLHAFIIELALISTPLDRGQENRFYLWLNPSTLFLMETKVKGRENLKLAFGRREVIHVEMQALLKDIFGSFAARFLNYIVPRHHFWFDAENGRPLLKYTGPMGQFLPMGVPNETHEVIEYSPGE